MTSVDDRLLDPRSLKSRDDLVEELAVHPHGVGLSVGPIQVGLVENVPVVPLFAENEPSCLVGRNPCHGRCRFMSGCHTEAGICHAEGIRFIVEEEPHLARSLVDNPNSQVVWGLGRLLLYMSNLGGITYRAAHVCILAVGLVLVSWSLFIIGAQTPPVNQFR